MTGFDLSAADVTAAGTTEIDVGIAQTQVGVDGAGAAMASKWFNYALMRSTKAARRHQVEVAVALMRANSTTATISVREWELAKEIRSCRATSKPARRTIVATGIMAA